MRKIRYTKMLIVLSSDRGEFTLHRRAPKMRILILIQAIALLAEGRVLDFEVDLGGIPDDISEDTAWYNGGLLNSTLPTLMPGDTFIFPDKTFYLMGGILVSGISSVKFVIDGTLLFSNDTRNW